MLIAVCWPAGAAQGSETPAPNNTAASPESGRKKLLSERDRLRKATTEFISRGKYAEALEFGKRALAIDRSLFGERSLEAADSLALVATVDERREDWLAAASERDEVLANRSKQLGKEHWQTADARRAVELTAKLRQLDPAERKRLWEADHNAEVVGRLLQQRKLLDAIPFAQRVVEARKALLGSKHWQVADALYQLGRCYLGTRDWAKSRAAFDEALSIRRAIFGENHPQVALSLNDLGTLQWSLGDYASALVRYEESLAIRRKVLPKDHVDIAKGLANLGLIQGDLRDYASARANMMESLTIFRRVLPKEHPIIAPALTTLGGLQEKLHDYVSARRSFEEVLAIRRRALPKDHPEIAATLDNLGVVQNKLGDLESARTSHEEALAIMRKVLPKDDLDLALTLNNLAQVQSALQDHTSASLSDGEALAIRRKILPKYHPDIAQSLVNLGDDQTRLHDYVSARKNLEEALAIRRKILPKDHPRIALSLTALGSSILVEGTHLRDAVTQLEEATDLYQKDQLRVALLQAEREQLATAAETHRTLSLLLSAALEAKMELGAIYERVLRVKGQVTAQQRWVREARNTADLETKRLLARLRQVNEGLLDSSIAGRTPGGSGRSQDTVALIERCSSERDELERLLSEHSQAYRTFQAKARVDSRQIRAALPAGIALVDLVEYRHVALPLPGQREASQEPRLVAFVVRPDRDKVAAVPLGSSALLAKLVDDWRASYGAGRLPTTGSPDPATELRQQLWNPLEGSLKGVKLVLVSPDGPLNGLPWAALPGTRAGRFLLEDYAFSIIPIPQLLPELVRNESGPRSDLALLTVGNVDFEARLDPQPTIQSAIHFSALPGTEAEVQAVQDLFRSTFPTDPTERLTGKNATKQAFVDRAPNCSCVVVCTHGFFLSDPGDRRLNGRAPSRASDGLRLNQNPVVANPGLRSGLAFAGANWAAVGHGTAFLTALEASEMDLHRVDLAVLSACETGRGEVAGGEGVLGLQRAFQVAGARTCITSLWKVDDTATQVLMREFYTNLWQKRLGKLEALRRAQISMLRRYDASEKRLRGLDLASDDRATRVAPGSPFYWAAFVLSGDWR
jgi:CHAT domain-containing protein